MLTKGVLCMRKRSSVERSLNRRILGVTMPIRNKRMRWGRNWPCMCGSEKKYKNCCQQNTNALTLADGNADVVELSEDVQKLVKTHQEAIVAKSGTRVNEENGGENRYEGKNK